jgi:LmbE family N-acetylglucosaminyl deacetylase
MNSQAETERRWVDFRRRMEDREAATPLNVLFLAAHPDDETIGASLLLARFPQTRVVYLTDGAPRDRRFWSPSARGLREDYAEIRKQEAQNALALAGVLPQRLVWLSAVDQEAILEVRRLTDMFAGVLQKHQPEIVVTHSYEGGHPDHDTAALIARLAVSRGVHGSLLLEMTSYHARSGSCVTGEFLNADANEMVCELSGEDCARKRRMMDEHASQRGVLAGFSINRERFRSAPEYDFTKAPHEGRLWYECMEWPMTGAQWRLLAATAIQEMQECNATHSA